MLRHNSNIALHSIYSNSILRYDTRRQSIQSVQFQWSSWVAFDDICFEISLWKIAVLKEWQVFLAKLSWDVANSYTISLCPTKLSYLKVTQIKATRLYLHRFQPPSIQILWSIFPTIALTWLYKLLYHMDNSFD